MPAHRVEIGAKHMGGTVGGRKPGEPKGCSQEFAVLEHALLDNPIRPQQERLRNRQA